MAGSCNQKIVVVCGPTASGKTGQGIRLAQELNGEILSADSMQIYRDLDIGTAKPTPEERALVPHHLIDFLPPEQPFSVADYLPMAQECIRDVASRGRLPIVVGGTGLYISSLTKGIRFAEQKAEESVRLRLRQEALEEGAQAMYEKLCALDPEGAAKIHPNNQVRVLRALELLRTTGRTMTEQKAESLPEESPYQVLCLALCHADRNALYRRIEQRIDTMMEAGLLGEAEWVYRNREAFRTAAQAIGYKEFFPYFEGEESLALCVENLKKATRHYAKRQLTWFRHMENVTWLDIGQPDFSDQALELARKFMGESSL